MSFEDWIFSVHLLFAATLVGSMVMAWILIFAQFTIETADATLSVNRVAMVGSVLIVVGLVGTISLGLWLADLREAISPTDGWVIAALVLWVIATAAIVRSFAEYAKAVRTARALVASGERGASAELAALNRTSAGLLLRAVGSLAIVLIVIDMLWKPGA